MRTDKIAVLLICIVVVAGLVALRMLQSSQTQVIANDHTALKPSAAGEFRGICLQLHNGLEDYPWEQYVNEIAATGANTIALTIAAYQENCTSTSIFVDIRKTPTDQQLEEIIDYAHNRGLRVVLTPIVLLENPRQDEWRGKIAPTNWMDWWEDYENYIMHYVWLAEATGVEVFMVGSELVSTEADGDRWRDLIARVRNAYSGRLAYSANWDHYKQVSFWDVLDIIGMTTYHDLGDDPNVSKLIAKWEPIKAEVLDWQQNIGRPILFTEVGWPNQVTCTKYPWDYYRSVNKPDPQRQANCFEAFFKTWAAEPAVTGYLIWEWRSYPGQVTDPDKDTSYVPCDKPAMDVISHYLRIPMSQGDTPLGTTQPAMASGENIEANRETPN